MKLAVAGKGGSGKTSISGTMARLMARQGRTVLAIDGDTNPNLALTLGIPAEEMGSVPTLPRDLLRRTDDGPVLTRPLEEVRHHHAHVGPDGVELMVMALPDQAGTGCFCSMHATVRTIIGAAPDTEHAVTLLDTEATPEHLSRGTAQFADAMLIVVEPYFKSLETGRRMAVLADDLGLDEVALVANKVRDARDEEAVTAFAERHALTVTGTVPFDPVFGEAERAGRAPLDVDPDAPAIVAIADLARRWGGTGRG